MTKTKTVTIFVPEDGDTRQVGYTTDPTFKTSDDFVQDIWFTGIGLFIKVSEFKTLTYVGLPFVFEMLKDEDEIRKEVPKKATGQ